MMADSRDSLQTRVTGLIEPSTQWVPSPVPPKIKRPGRKADNTHPPSAEANNQWCYTSAAPCALIVRTAFKKLRDSVLSRKRGVGPDRRRCSQSLGQTQPYKK